MEQVIYKTFNAEVKGINETDGTVELAIPLSTPSMDRDHESINPLAFKQTLKDFMKRPILLSSHNYGDLRKQIGEFVSLKITEDGLIGKPKWYINSGNDEADWAFSLAKRGMAAFSVGFIPLEWDDGEKSAKPRRNFTNVELLEVSQVVVPSNREAIQGVRGKSHDPIVNELIEKAYETITKPEETENYIRIPAPGEEGKHNDHRIRTIDISAEKGIRALYCGECKVVITYLFAKENGWTMEKARAWVKEHEKAWFLDVTAEEIAAMPEPQIEKPTQAEIGDELDYIKELIKDGLDEENTKLASELAITILTLPGCVIPVDILEKFKPTKQRFDPERIYNALLAKLD